MSRNRLRLKIASLLLFAACAAFAQEARARLETLRNMFLPRIDADKVRTTAKEVAYTAIGLGVLGFQKAQVRRREVTEQLSTELPKVANEALAQAEKVVSKVVATVQSRRGVATPAK